MGILVYFCFLLTFSIENLVLFLLIDVYSKVLQHLPSLLSYLCLEKLT